MNVSSIGGSVGFPYTEVYSAAKDVLIAFTRVLRADYRKQGVSSFVFSLIWLFRRCRFPDTADAPLSPRLASPAGGGRSALGVEKAAR